MNNPKNNGLLTVSNSDNHFMFYYEKGGEEVTCHYRTKISDDTEKFIS